MAAPNTNRNKEILDCYFGKPNQQNPHVAEGQYGDDICLKTMYCLADRYREPFEHWLQKNDFTDFGILRESQLGQPDICSAMAEIHIYRYGEEELQ